MTTSQPLTTASNAPPMSDDIITRALVTGTMTGAGGVLGGSIAAVARGLPSKGIFAAGTGLSCFVLGTMYSGIRQNLVKEILDPKRPASSREKLQVSAMAGGLTGGIGGLVLRGPKNVLPGVIMFTLFSFSGQFLYNLGDAQHTASILAPPKEHKAGMFERMLGAKNSPIKKLSNEEYKDMMREKMFGLEADIAIVDEEIEKLKRRQLEDRLNGSTKEKKST